MEAPPDGPGGASSFGMPGQFTGRNAPHIAGRSEPSGARSNTPPPPI
jgi:hypothetical protein